MPDYRNVSLPGYQPPGEIAFCRRPSLHLQMPELQEIFRSRGMRRIRNIPAIAQTNRSLN